MVKFQVFNCSFQTYSPSLWSHSSLLIIDLDGHLILVMNQFLLTTALSSLCLEDIELAKL